MNMETTNPEYSCSECGTDVAQDATVCPSCGANLEDASIPPALLSEQSALDIEKKLAELSSRIPDSGIIHASLWRRIWTVYGYSVVGGLVIVLGFYFLGLLLKGCVG
jgi:uncharacterized membrane protein YvbJ